MGRIVTTTTPGGPPGDISIGEPDGELHLQLELDYLDESVAIKVPHDGAGWGWFWLEANGSGHQTIDDVIEALEAAKRHLLEARDRDGGE
jgi:hypothetical protein